jgi:putative membrane protein
MVTASGSLSEIDHARIADAVRVAEQSTAGEIYVVIARSPHEPGSGPLLLAAVLALLLPWPLFFLTDLSITAVLIIQVAFFILAAIGLPLLGPRLAWLDFLADAVRRRARTIFLAHGVHLTDDRTGVLIYLALAERQVEIVADRTIHSRVEQSVWDEIAAMVAESAREGRITEGILAAVDKSGAVLAAHFPPRPGDRNELPDHVVEI